MSKSIIRYCLLALFLALSSLLFSQTKKELEIKKKKLQQEIEYTNKLLDETKKNKDLTLDQLVKLNRKIGTRGEIIATINAELRLLERQISNKRVIVEALEQDLKELKEEYSKMIYYSYKNKSSYNRLMFVFSATNFNEAYKRLKYLQQYTSYRRRQADLIAKTKMSIANELADMEDKRKSKRKLLDAKQYEHHKLTGEKQQQERVVVELKKKEQDLLKELKRKQRTAQKLERAIEEIIKEEIRKAQEAASKAGKKSSGFPMTPEAQKLSNSFSANKGKLPWPVEQGVITGKFGTHAHPVLTQVTVKNNGIDISTSEGAIARAVFDGEVSRVIIIPGEGKSVLVRHGEYLTVYSFLSEVYVKAGDKITTKQPLGLLVSDKANSKTDMHFELWKGMDPLNPEYWVYKK
jgi:septal ring factor EnvC (AmiA/AmiB activator)